MEHSGKCRFLAIICFFCSSLTWEVCAQAQNFNNNIERETESILPEIPDEPLERSITIVDQPVYRFEPTFIEQEVDKSLADKQGEVWSLIQSRRGSRFPLLLPQSDFLKLFPGEKRDLRKPSGLFSDEDAQFILEQIGEPSLLNVNDDAQPVLNNLLKAPLTAADKLGFMRKVDVDKRSVKNLDAILKRFNIPLFKTTTVRGKPKRVKIGVEPKKIIGGRKSKLTFFPSGGPTFRSNAFFANNAVEDRIVVFGGSLSYKIPIGNKDDTLTLASGQNFTRYDRFEVKDRDIYRGGITYTHVTGREFPIDGMKETIRYALNHRSIWRSEFEGTPFTLSTPSVTYVLSGIPIGKSLCGKPEKPMPCTTATVSAGLRHAISNQSAADNTTAGLTLELSHSLPKQNLSFSLTTGVDGSVYTNVVGGRQDLYFSGAAKVSWTGLKSAELSADVVIGNNRSTISRNNYENVDVRPRVRLTIPLGEWEHKRK